MKHGGLACCILAAVTMLGCTTYEHRTPKSWRGVVNGMPKENVYSLLGQPNTPQLENSPDIWVSRSWELDVFYDQFGRVTNVTQQYLLR